MHRIFAILLLGTLISIFCLLLSSCTESGTKPVGGESTEQPNPPKDDGSTDGSGTESGSKPDEDTDAGKETPPESDDGESDDAVIAVPEYKDYGRGTVDFWEMVYSRPDTEHIINAFTEIAKKIEENTLPFEDLIAEIELLEDPYTEMDTMLTYAYLMNSKDKSDEYWAEEYAFLSGEHPSFAKAVEDMFVAAAQSEQAERFEDEYFGEGLIEEYAEGGRYTDELVALLENESAIEAEYSALSTANVRITYLSVTDTFDRIIEYYKDVFGEESSAFAIVISTCTELYRQKLNELTRDILVRLVRVRRDISDALGYPSYATLAYEEIYHDYSETDALTLISDIKNYIIPVYITVENFVFSNFFEEYEAKSPTRAEVINTVYSYMTGLDAELGDIFSYMLQHELYDVSDFDENRFEGSFSTYLTGYEAPYLFVTLEGDSNDYMTLAHEFGHFADSFINYASYTSLDLKEVYSNSLEWLLLDAMESELSVDEKKFMTYSRFRSTLEVFIYQGFYALFEHYVYSLERDSINEYSLEMAVDRAASAIGFSPEMIDLDAVLIPHIVLYPFYVQSYCVSEAIALDIYFTEKKTDGTGLVAYKTLIDRSDSDLTLEEHLERAGLDSPFKKDYLMRLADMIHYEIMGSHIFTGQSGGSNAA